MCGICGFVQFDKAINGAGPEILKRMNGKLEHRGPDDQGIWMFENVAFGFRRLSIIGLDNGMQPISNEDGSVILICNGEIFNYIELRNELKKRGHVFGTAVDVEVIVHLYEEMGMRLLEQLNGQFAFSLYDKRKRLLYCCRDQMGIIPFYYAFARNTFIFGSEIKAILEHPDVSPSVDLTSLDQVMTFAGLVSPRTMFAGINSLENGHYLCVDDSGRIEKKEYWDLIYPEKGKEPETRSEDYYIDRLEELFEESIRLRLRADVPSGLYLSGGLDSSMIAMKIRAMNPALTLNAFSIDFTGSEYSEATYQKLVARETGAILQQASFHSRDVETRLRQAIYHSECPIKETYNTASLVLSELVRSQGIKVIQSGEGADELFAGYVGYRFDKMRAIDPANSSVSPAERALRCAFWGDDSFFYEKNYRDLAVVKKSLYSDAVNLSYEQFSSLNNTFINKERIRNRDVLHKRAYVDYKFRLVDHLVSDHGDRMALANSVEVRYPFLDIRLAEFSTQVPPDLKLNNFTEKYILKRMAKRFVPSAVTEREKFHFIAPGSPQLLRSDIEYVNDILSYDLIRKQGIFNPDQVERLKRQYSEEGFFVNAPYEDDLMIIVLTFGILLDQFPV